MLHGTSLRRRSEAGSKENSDAVRVAPTTCFAWPSFTSTSAKGTNSLRHARQDKSQRMSGFSPAELGYQRFGGAHSTHGLTSSCGWSCGTSVNYSLRRLKRRKAVAANR